MSMHDPDRAMHKPTCFIQAKLNKQSQDMLESQLKAAFLTFGVDLIVTWLHASCAQ